MQHSPGDLHERDGHSCRVNGQVSVKIHDDTDVEHVHSHCKTQKTQITQRHCPLIALSSLKNPPVASLCNNTNKMKPALIRLQKLFVIPAPGNSWKQTNVSSKPDVSVTAGLWQYAQRRQTERCWRRSTLTFMKDDVTKTRHWVLNCIPFFFYLFNKKNKK